MSEEQEILDFVKWFRDTDTTMGVIVRKWIETYSPYENISDINVHIPSLEVIFDTNGERWPKNGTVRFAGSPATEITITLKDGSVHSAGYLENVGLYKLDKEDGML